jgi:glycosyltransferase involved in cell wall biosynthesis
MVAFACRPGGTSETGAGWAFAQAATALGHDVTLITQPRHRSSIERRHANDPVLRDRLSVQYVGLPAGVMDGWERRGHLRGLQLYNLGWQWAVARVARRLHSAAPFELGHHVTLSTDWIPTGLVSVPGLPVVWGPLGGGERVPGPCRVYLGPKGRRTEQARELLTRPLRSMAEGTGRRCALLVAQNADEGARLAALGTPVDVRPNVFLGEECFTQPVRSSSAEPRLRRRAVFAGRLLAWKGVHLALATMTVAHDWELVIYGDGPERTRVADSVRWLGLSDRVTLMGRRPRSEVRQAMVDADVFFFPSMREAAGWVVAEALAVGCPVVCLNTGGPPLLVGSSGCVVDPGPDLPERLADALAAAAALPREQVRWDEHALPALVSDWYTRAAARGAVTSRSEAP